MAVYDVRRDYQEANQAHTVRVAAVPVRADMNMNAGDDYELVELPPFSFVRSITAIIHQQETSGTVLIDVKIGGATTGTYDAATGTGGVVPMPPPTTHNTAPQRVAISPQAALTDGESVVLVEYVEYARRADHYVGKLV